VFVEWTAAAGSRREHVNAHDADRVVSHHVGVIDNGRGNDSFHGSRDDTVRE